MTTATRVETIAALTRAEVEELARTESEPLLFHTGMRGLFPAVSLRLGHHRW
jgi:hypothetical protein